LHVRGKSEDNNCVALPGKNTVIEENGAHSLIRSLVASGVDTCFANPGTSEMHFVAALDHVPEMRGVLALSESVVTGAADGYGRMAGKPAVTLLHLGVGLANGLSNLHNARRAETPIVNVVGDHATYHLQHDAPLTSDIAGIARPVSAWVHTGRSAATIGADGARAVQAARAAPGQIATLILPADTAWNAGGPAAPALPIAVPAVVSHDVVVRVARQLRDGKHTAFLMRGEVLKERGLSAAGRIAAATQCRLFSDTFSPRTSRGAGRVTVEALPYFAEVAADFLKDLQRIVLVGTKAPVAFFAYPDKPSWLLPKNCEIVYLAHEHEDGIGALEAVAESLGAQAKPANVAPFELPELPSGKFNGYTIGKTIGHFMPEGAIISDDGATSSVGTIQATATARPHDHLMLTGGAIGIGMPMALGAAVACPDRKVITLCGDGSAMYTLQALWTQARENLDITTVVFSNRSYRILKVELERVGAVNAGPRATRLLDLRQPELDWVGLAKGMGVEASRATSIDQFNSQFKDAVARKGPRLIEAIV
jgi:acetolactate synthase-1/2/3 large subunit